MCSSEQLASSRADLNIAKARLMGTDLKKELAQGMDIIRSFGNYSLSFLFISVGFPTLMHKPLPDAQYLQLACWDYRYVFQLVANTVVVLSKHHPVPPCGYSITPSCLKLYRAQGWARS